MALTIKELIEIIPQVGEVKWIGIRPQKRGIVKPVDSVEITKEDGLANDHYSKEDGKRTVTLIQQEHIMAVTSILGKEQIDPAELRRNIVVSGINLLALKEKTFKIGEEVILEMTGLCHPCSRMETNLGAGGYNAMRGHGGITAKVIQGGTIRIGDHVQVV